LAARQTTVPRVLNLAFGRSCVLTASTHLGPRSSGILWYRLPASPVDVQEIVDHGEDAPSRRNPQRPGQGGPGAHDGGLGRSPASIACRRSRRIVAGSNPAVPASRHRALALATMPQDRLRAILCRRRWADVLDQGVQLSGPAVDSDLPGPQSAQPLDRQARRRFKARAGRREHRGRQPDDLQADRHGRRPMVNMSSYGTRWQK
jgi:hypothetical protein